MTVKTNQPTKVPALPSVPQAGITPELATYLRNLNDAVDIRLGRKGDARDRAVTLRELIEGGIVLEANSGAFNTNVINGQTVGMGPTTAPELPITPTQAAGLNVAPLYSQLYLTWDSPTYLGHLFTEIYRHTADVLGDAEFLTYAVGAAYVDPVGGGQTFYYWIRHVSNTGNVGQWNAAAGTVGTTPTDVSVLLSRLNGALSESELAAALTSRINLIDASGNVNGSVAQRIAAEATARTGAVTGLQDQINTLSAVADWDSTVAYSNNDLAVYSGNLYKAIASSTNVQPDTDATKWQDLGAYSSLAEVVAANEAAITQLNTVTSGSTSANALALTSVIATTGTNTGAINELNNVSADSTSATALRMFELQAIVDAIDAPQWAHESISTSYAVGDVVISGLNNSAVWSYGANIPAALDIIYDPIQRAIEIPKLPGGDVATGITFDAFDIGDADSFTISFDVRGDENKGSGLYARVYGGSRANVGNHAYVSYSLDADNTLVYQAVASDRLPITGLSYASATGTVEDEEIFAAWTNCSFTVTPSSGKEDWLYSLSVLNWTGNASNSLYLRNIKITENLAAGATGRSWDYSSRARKCVAAHSAKSLSDSDYWEDIGSARSALETSRVQGDIKSLNDISATSDSVNARAIKQVSAMLGGSGSTIEQLLSSTASADGLNAQYTLKIDSNGAVSGFGLSSLTNTAGVSTTEFIINADKFQVIAPNASDLNSAETFFSVVTADVYEQDASGNSTGVVSVPAGVYMADGFIKNASITGAKIGNAAIDSAQIADAAINSAQIGDTIQSENWNDVTKSGWRISKADDIIEAGGINIWDSEGNVILASDTTEAQIRNGSQKWSDVSGAGRPADDATRNVFRGAYNSSTTYAINDMVVYSGQVYICIQAGSGNAPSGTTASTGYWSIFSERGEQGVQGVQGVQGDQGLQGPVGTAGTSTYFHIAYATSASGDGFDTANSSGKTYIGTYVDSTASDASSTSSLWNWSLIQGPQGDTGDIGPQGDTGDTGPQGVVGPVGPQGTILYTWIRYADDSSGNGIDNDPTGKEYIGFSYNNTTATESTNAGDYTWSLIQGAQGNTGVQGPQGPTGQASYTWIKYAANASGTSGFSDTPQSGTEYIGIATNKTTANESTNAGDYTWSKFKGDTGSQGLQGDPGATGLPGTNGADGTTYYLHLAYATSSDGSSGFSVSDATNKTYIGQYVDTNAADSTNSALYSWSLIKGADGADGTDGTDGVDGALGGGLDFGFTNAAIDATGAVSKTTISTSYDSSIYTNNAYTSGCFLTFKTLTNDVSYMVALNDDPSSSSNYSTLDYAWWLSKSGVISIYESYVNKVLDSGQPNTYAVGDIFSITYDNDKIRYLHNGVVKRTVATNTDRTFHFDSTLQQNSSGASIQGVKVFTNIAFGPQGQVGVSESTIIGTDVDWVAGSPMSSVLGDWKRLVSFGVTPAISPSGPGFDGGPFGDSSNLGLRFNGRGTSEAKGWQARVGYYFSNNKNSTYWFTCFVKRRSDDTDPADTLKTGFYTGLPTTNPGRVTPIGSSTASTNPYFHPNFGINEFPDSDKWYLVVGVVHPHDYAGVVSGISGVYDLETGAKVPGQGASNEWKWVDSYTKNDHYWRLGFYTTDTTYGNAVPPLNAPTNRGYIVCRPSIYITDGTQPDLQSIMNNNKVAITPQNIGTYIQDLAVQTLHIADGTVFIPRVIEFAAGTYTQSYGPNFELGAIRTLGQTGSLDFSDTQVSAAVAVYTEWNINYQVTFRSVSLFYDYPNNTYSSLTQLRLVLRVQDNAMDGTGWITRTDFILHDEPNPDNNRSLNTFNFAGDKWFVLDLSDTVNRGNVRFSLAVIGSVQVYPNSDGAGSVTIGLDWQSSDVVIMAGKK